MLNRLNVITILGCLFWLATGPTPTMAHAAQHKTQDVKQESISSFWFISDSELLLRNGHSYAVFSLRDQGLKPVFGADFEVLQVLPPQHLILKKKMTTPNREPKSCLYHYDLHKQHLSQALSCPETGISFWFTDPHHMYWYNNTDIKANQIHHSDFTTLREQMISFDSPFPAYEPNTFGRWVNFAPEGLVTTQANQVMLYDYQGRRLTTEPISTLQKSPICCFTPLASVGDYLFRNMDDQIFRTSESGTPDLLFSDMSNPQMYPFPSRWAAQHSFGPLKSTGFWLSRMNYQTRPYSFWLYRYDFTSKRLVSYPISEPPLKLEPSPSGAWLALLNKSGKLSLYESASGRKQDIALPSAWQPPPDQLSASIMPPQGPPDDTTAQMQHWCEFSFRHPGRSGCSECDILQASQALKMGQRNVARRLLTPPLTRNLDPKFKDRYHDLRDALGFSPTWRQTINLGSRYDETSMRTEKLRIDAMADQWIKAPGRLALDAKGRIVTYDPSRHPSHTAHLYLPEPYGQAGMWRPQPEYTPVDLATDKSTCTLQVSWGNPDLPSYDNFWYHIFCHDAEQQQDLLLEPPPNNQFATDAKLLAIGHPLSLLMTINGRFYLKSLAKGDNQSWEQIQLPLGYTSYFNPLRLDNGQYLLPTENGLYVGSPDLRHWRPTALKHPLQEVGRIDESHWWGRHGKDLLIFGALWQQQEATISAPITLPFEGSFISSQGTSPVWVHSEGDNFSWSRDLKTWQTVPRPSRLWSNSPVFFYQGRFWDQDKSQLYALNPEDEAPDWQVVQTPEHVYDMIVADDILLITTPSGVYRHQQGEQPWQRVNRGLPNNTFLSTPAIAPAQTPERPVPLGIHHFIWTGQHWRTARTEELLPDPQQNPLPLQQQVDCQGHHPTHYMQQGEHQAAICDDHIWVKSPLTQGWQPVSHPPVTLAFELISSPSAWVYVHADGLIRYDIPTGNWQTLDLPLKQWTYNQKGDWALFGDKTFWYSSDQAQTWREIAYQKLCDDCQGWVLQAVLREDRLSFLFGQYWLDFPLNLPAFN